MSKRSATLLSHAKQTQVGKSTPDDMILFQPLTLDKNDSNYNINACQTGNKYSEIYGLRRKICVAVRLIYSISCNMWTEDGLINGATCILKKIQNKETISEALPKIL